eukprot:TRINITY_DN36173_c0_g1_i1.p1 TRINITY_DN36173_c0_g1~~TRINITY_DN36173_c0_g1_i1.p1  ORF type:complete len:101 (-),score=22.29 TRINITY_DN36173_c0_g1_i1:148-414(-)
MSPSRWTRTSPAKMIHVDESSNSNRVDKLTGSTSSPGRGWSGGSLSFSPLSSSSLHKLHTSPLVPHQYTLANKGERRKGKRVNKQLYN